MLYRMVFMLYSEAYTKLSNSLQSQCGGNWMYMYYLYSEYKQGVLLV